MINTLRSRHSPHIQKHNHIRLKQRTKRIERPPMAVDLLLVLLLHAKEDLRGYDALVGVSEVQVRVEPEGGGVFEEVGGDWFVVESRLHVGTGLVDSEEGEYV